MKFWLALGVAVCAAAQDQDKETVLGDLLAEQIREQSAPADESVQQYVRQVAARVAPGSTWKVETIVRDELGIGMLATLARGHIFVPSRVLVLARNEAELAGVLAHAMSHRVERPAGMPVIFGEGLRPEEEVRADHGAVAKMAAAGYSPHALLDYVERVARPTPRRIAALKEAIAAAPPRAEWIENTSAFVEAQSRVRPREPRPRQPPSLLKKK